MLHLMSDQDLSDALREHFHPLYAEQPLAIEGYKRFWIVFRVSRPDAFDAVVRELEAVVAHLCNDPVMTSDGLQKHTSVSLKGLSADSWLLELIVPDPERDGAHSIGALLYGSRLAITRIGGATHMQGLPIELWQSRSYAHPFPPFSATITAPPAVDPGVSHDPPVSPSGQPL